MFFAEINKIWFHKNISIMNCILAYKKIVQLSRKIEVTIHDILIIARK